MGEHSHELDDTWGWPGLGTYASGAPEAPRKGSGSTDSGAPQAPRQESVSKGKEPEPPRRESTISQASKKSSDTQTGWPGLVPSQKTSRNNRLGRRTRRAEPVFATILCVSERFPGFCGALSEDVPGPQR
ncbi:hypothetical protein PHISCL_10290 [Aspergillus sclerotialis]|uniref:Uncharacterized protein n=1 Tax=Aspergillus sclerotialis TaxID=2070753 RepID=A0A3A2ZDF5_9EURO|nr:hypothetical protein PHISCL_10290 [Aspergillus sclerotialis]